MSIFTKKNAAVGYITLKAASRALERRRRKRSGLRLVLYVALGLISFGVLAGLVAVFLRRQQGESQHPEGNAAADEDADEDDSEVVGEYVMATPEPIPAT